MFQFGTYGSSWIYIPKKELSVQLLNVTISIIIVLADLTAMTSSILDISLQDEGREKNATLSAWRSR